MAASRIKSVSFRDDEKDLLDYAEKKENFSDYVKRLIKEDKEKGFRFNKEQEEAIIQLIQKYAPTVKKEDIEHEFDNDAITALNQFDDM